MVDAHPPVHVLLRQAAEAHPHHLAQRVRVGARGEVVGAPSPAVDAPGAGWREVTYAHMVEQVDAFAAALLGLGADLDTRVAILSPNRPEWHVVDYGAMTIGAVVVPVHVTSPVDHVRHILESTAATVIAIEGQQQLDRLGPLLDDLTVISFDVVDDERVLLLDDLLAQGGAEPRDSEIARRLEAVRGDQLATIIHTSGTTGIPKGVPLTHDNLTPQYAAVIEGFGLDETDRSLCFLPLSHALERGWSALAFAAGATSTYVHNPREVGDYLPAARPTVMVSVPRLYEKVYATAQARAGEPGSPKRRIFDWALRVGNAYHHRRWGGHGVSPLLAAQYRVADRLVLHNVRDAVGGEKKCFAVGGAPLRTEVEEFFASAGLLISQGYGLTETAPLVSFNGPGATRFGTVGRAIGPMDVRVGESGELQVRGPGVMAGYLDDTEATAAVLDDEGWFTTGDLAEIDDDGYITITGRTKDLLITDGGRNIAPSPIEAALEADVAVEYAMVVGDGRPYLTALVQPDFAQLPALARSVGVEVADDAPITSLADVAAHPDVVAEYQRRAVEATAPFSSYEQVKRVHVLGAPLSMDAGELTPTLKVRRATMTERYADAIEGLYAG